jgi:hypothetical protein
VKYIECLIVIYIIHNFQQITIQVKADEQMLAGFGIPQIVIQPGINGTANIRLGTAMLKCSLVKFDNNLHLPFRIRHL